MTNMMEYLRREACNAFMRYIGAFEEVKKETGPNLSFDESKEMPESLAKALYYAEDCLADYKRKFERYNEYVSE